jgi:hypothetical protein
MGGPGRWPFSLHVLLGPLGEELLVSFVDVKYQGVKIVKKFVIFALAAEDKTSVVDLSAALRVAEGRFITF